jgi:hypothetical protein
VQSVALDWSIWIPDVCLWSKTFLYKGRHKEEGVSAVEVPQLRVEAGKVFILDVKTFSFHPAH